MPSPTDKKLGINEIDINAPSDSITLSERDAMLEEAGVSKLTRSWQQLEKNMLFLRSGYLTPPELQKKYPELSQEQISAVINTALKHDASHRL